MSQRREIEARLAIYEDLAGILGAMRSFALAELHRVMRREAAQAEVVAALAATLRDLAPILPAPPTRAGDVWLLFGSVRGFCGSFNEDVQRHWQASGGVGAPTVVVGERLAARLAEGGPRIRVAGPVGSLDAAAAIDGILAALYEARRPPPGDRAPGEWGVMLCFRDELGARSERLLPFTWPEADSRQPLPLLQEPAPRVAAQVAEHFLFHTLLARLLHAIRIENRMRMLQMENALQHLERGSEDLQRDRNRLRQEEIVEEIELMLQGRDGDGMTKPGV